MEKTIRKFSMLDHPFYQLWNRGELPLETITEYAKQYYAQVKAFPTYVSGVHARCEDMECRQILLENLIEEEHGDDNHPELWLRFADGLGLNRDEVKNQKLLKETEESVETMKNLTQDKNYLKGLAALYAYESQIPEVSKTKREGLKKFYNIEDDRVVSFFSVHEKADLIHRQVEQDILKNQCTSKESQQEVLQSAGDAAKALWNFLNGIYENYVESVAVC
jgi:pyrroloquinoline-quinone synthase|tara:strand:- start:6076 stop:6738 length:663 start_codon:yes stop_codon:yes gene_type:complete